MHEIAGKSHVQSIYHPLVIGGCWVEREEVPVENELGERERERERELP